MAIILFSVAAVSCTKEKSVENGLPTIPGSGGSAVFALNTSGDSCVNSVVAGTYAKGTPTGSANTVTIEINVNSPGTWSINTATVGGFYFSGSGAFANTGTQTVTLTAKGTPQNEGTETFTLLTGTATCTFDVTVGQGGGTPPPPTTTTGDYLPTTNGSWWSYDDAAGSDTMLTKINGTKSLNGKTYQNYINTYEGTTDTDTSFIRKDNTTGFYYIYSDLRDLDLASLGMTFPNFAELLFLKNNVAANDTWNSDVNGTFNGLPATLRFTFSVVSITETLNTGISNFTNVLHITMTPKIGFAGTFTALPTPPVEFYYAKGVGQLKIDDGGDQQVIRYYKIL